MAIAVPMALALVFAAAETTSDMMGGKSDPGTHRGSTNGDEVGNNLSPAPNPQVTGVQRPNPGATATVGNPTNGPQVFPTATGVASATSTTVPTATGHHGRADHGAGQPDTDHGGADERRADHDRADGTGQRRQLTPHPLRTPRERHPGRGTAPVVVGQRTCVR